VQGREQEQAQEQQPLVRAQEQQPSVQEREQEQRPSVQEREQGRVSFPPIALSYLQFARPVRPTFYAQAS
jgi:hypothetical protein